MPTGREPRYAGRSHDAGHAWQPQEECADCKGTEHTEHTEHADCDVLDLGRPRHLLPGSYMVPTGVQAGTGTRVPMSRTSSATFAYRLILELPWRD